MGQDDRVVTSRRRNLILIHRGPEYQNDFTEIGQKVIALDASIAVFHLPARLVTELPAGAWQYPTLTVALTSQFRLPIRRGPILRNTPIDKLVQQEIFRRNGIQTPFAVPFQFGMKLDPALFGDFVILKPSDLGMTSQGLGIQVFRRARLELLTASSFPPSHPVRWSPQGFIVQQFVHTGTYPLNYRATTFLGDVMTLEVITGSAPTPPLSAPDDEIERANFSTKEDRNWTTVDDPHVIRFARQVAAAFPAIPLLGIDVIRSTSQQLHALEVNAGGNTWHYSSKMCESDRIENPEHYVRMRNQFGAFDIAARRLTLATQRLAS